MRVSHAAPARHFPDRQALLDALAISGFERLETRLRVALDAADETFTSRLRATVAAYIGYATEHATLLELMFSTKHRPGADDVAAAAVPAFTLMSEVIVHGQEDGALAAGDPEQVGIILFATMQGIATVINGDIVEHARVGELIDSAVHQFVHGMHPD